MSRDETVEQKPHYLGHRNRLRQRVLKSGAGSLSDYELIEFLLFAAKPRADVKPLAKRVLREFGSLGNVLCAEVARLSKVPGMSDNAATYLMVTREAARRLALQEASEINIIASWDKLVAYCRTVMGREKVEQFRLLFLDKKNMLIADELQQRGTVDHTPVYPREVLKRALELGATALILVHNHPSGDPTPSQSDIEMTREIQSAAEKVGIVIHDHLVIGRSGHVSFKARGLL